MTDRVQRSYIHGWQDERRGGRWARRVRWYEFRSEEGLSIRLNFAERLTQGAPRRMWIEVNRFYDTDDAATEDFERFVNGERAAVLRNEGE